MTHIIRPSVPKVVRRAFDAFSANDAVSVGEAFEQNAMLITHIDPALLAKIGLPADDAPVKVRGNLDISMLFAQEFETLQISHVEVHTELRVGRQLAALCDFDAKISATGESVSGRCFGIYTMNAHGRRIVKAQTVCKLITPGWNFKFN
ncbi:MAG: hypothetical protein KDJ37_01290 [Hyphomicrobiaceae bacterium]|nr:hypothetical protein [Hyphomicrobiaceae bacterium]